MPENILLRVFYCESVKKIDDVRVIDIVYVDFSKAFAKVFMVGWPGGLSIWESSEVAKLAW